MPIAEFKERDCSIPYKKFQELKDNDFIYRINYEDLTIKTYGIKDVNISKSRDFYMKNCYEVMFKIIDFDHEYPQRIVDGNCFIVSIYYNGVGIYFTTDKRIAEMIISILRDRNNYQWESFNKIFMHSTNKYNLNDIKYA